MRHLDAGKGLKKVAYPIFLVLCLAFSLCNAFTDAALAEEIVRPGKEAVKLLHPFEAAAQMAGTDIELGSIVLSTEKVKALKIAFKVNNTIYYLDEAEGVSRENSEFAEHGFQVYSNPPYGIFGDMLLLGGYAGATGHNTWLFLFEISKGRYIRLVDAWKNNYSGELRYELRPNFGKGEGFVSLSDEDKDGKPEVLVYFYELKFHLFIELTGLGMHVDLNPVLYEPLFRELRQTSKKTETEFRDYFIYGYLCGELSREQIIKQLRKNWKNEYTEIIQIIDDLPRLSTILKPEAELVLKKY